jgi:hypothetical protein
MNACHGDRSKTCAFHRPLECRRKRKNAKRGPPRPRPTGGRGPTRRPGRAGGGPPPGGPTCRPGCGRPSRPRRTGGRGRRAGRSRSNEQLRGRGGRGRPEQAAHAEGVVDAPAGGRVVGRVDFHADEPAAGLHAGNAGRAGAHERVEAWSREPNTSRNRPTWTSSQDCFQHVRRSPPIPTAALVPTQDAAASRRPRQERIGERQHRPEPAGQVERPPVRPRPTRRPQSPSSHGNRFRGMTAQSHTADRSPPHRPTRPAGRPARPGNPRGSAPPGYPPLAAPRPPLLRKSASGLAPRFAAICSRFRLAGSSPNRSESLNMKASAFSAIVKQRVNLPGPVGRLYHKVVGLQLPQGPVPPDRRVAILPKGVNVRIAQGAQLGDERDKSPPLRQGERGKVRRGGRARVAGPPGRRVRQAAGGRLASAGH